MPTTANQISDAASGGPLQPVPAAVQAAADFTTVVQHPHYMNPLRDAKHLILARTDQGVDFGMDNGSPIYPVGRARLTRYTMHSGWPGGGAVQYVLLDGDLKGTEHYVTEHLSLLPHLAVGDIVHVGTVICHYSGWYGHNGNWGIEMGYIRPGTNNPCSTDTSGKPTDGGICYTRLMNLLGQKTLQSFGPGPHDCPCGRVKL